MVLKKILPGVTLYAVPVPTTGRRRMSVEFWVAKNFCALSAVSFPDQEIRRRERVIRIFPNEDTAIRLIGAVLMDIDEAWTQESATLR